MNFDGGGGRWERGGVGAVFDLVWWGEGGLKNLRQWVIVIFED